MVRFVTFSTASGAALFPSFWRRGYHSVGRGRLFTRFLCRQRFDRFCRSTGRAARSRLSCPDRVWSSDRPSRSTILSRQAQALLAQGQRWLTATPGCRLLAPRAEGASWRNRAQRKNRAKPANNGRDVQTKLHVASEGTIAACNRRAVFPQRLDNRRIVVPLSTCRDRSAARTHSPIRGCDLAPHTRILRRSRRAIGRATRAQETR